MRVDLVPQSSKSKLIFGGFDMSYYVKRNDVKGIKGDGMTGFPMLNESHGCVNGCCTGIGIYEATEYKTPGVHSDQEGFVVMEGIGWAKIGEEEIKLQSDVSFIVPAGVKHCIKTSSASKPVKVFWFHSAV